MAEKAEEFITTGGENQQGKPEAVQERQSKPFSICVSPRRSFGFVFLFVFDAKTLTV
jgi:hypothetical protein